MKGWILASALVLGASPVAGFAQRPDLSDAQNRPGENGGLRAVGAEVLFWSQAQRDANFPDMERILFRTCRAIRR